MRRRFRALALAASALVIIAATVAPAATVLAGEPPSNHNFEQAQKITGLPATFESDAVDASAQTGEPTSSCSNGGGAASVWPRIGDARRFREIVAGAGLRQV